MSADYAVFMGICLLNPTLTNVGMGIQKLSINRLREDGAVNSARGAWAALWTSGLILQGLVVILAFKALSLGNASTLGGFAAFGIIVLAVFSRVVLKEEMLKQELAGMILVLAGTALLGFAGRGSQNIHVAVDEHGLKIFIAVFAVFAAAGLMLMRKNINLYGGAVLGAMGGALTGLAMVFQKIITSEFRSAAIFNGPELLKVLLFPYTVPMALGGVMGIVLVQFGYKYGKAIQVVPGFSSMVVIVPTLAGAATIGEPVTHAGLISIAIITLGVLVMSMSAPRLQMNKGRGI